MGGESDVVFVAPNGGDVLTNPIGGRMVLKVSGDATAGAYTLHDNTIPAGSPGPRPHLHRDHVETFYVLAGVLTLRAGAETIEAPAGSVVVIPRGVVHQPANPGDEPIRALILFSPGGMDEFFAEAAARRLPLQGASPTDPIVGRDLAEFTERYRYEFGDLGPPA